MLMPPERLEYYNKSLGQQLQRLVTSIRSYQALKALKTPLLLTQANRLWELNQRYRLVKGKDEAASFSLLSACQEAYQVLYDSILKLVEEIAEISVQVLEFDKECVQLAQEQQVPTGVPDSLKEFLNFLEESLNTLQNQTKYIELHLRQLHPKFALGESTLEAFKSDLQLPEHVEARLALGLARIERLLKYPLDFSHEQHKRLDDDPRNKVVA